MNQSSFIASFKERVLAMQEDDFDGLALEAFQYQSQCNPVYAQYLHFLKKDTRQVQRLEDIPFLPIEFFKTQKVLCNHASGSKVFESSGTTGQQSSKHYMADTVFYDTLAKKLFETQYGSIENYQILALLPSYLERTTSSLVHMVDSFMQVSGNESGFYLHDLTGLARKMMLLKEQRHPILLLGVTFAMLDLAESHSLDLGDGVIVMETGGMKGRRKEMLREQLHEQLCAQLGVKSIHSEYGMTELTSQAYSKGNGFFEESISMKLLIREINAPFSVHQQANKSGGINIIDLGNIDSCCFIETKDIGRLSNKGFEVLGRFDNSDIRGCNLLIA